MLNDIERDELDRILGLPEANRVPTENDVAFLKARIEYLNGDQIRQFGLLEPVIGAVVPIEVKKPTQAKKSPKIAAKKVVKAIKRLVKAKKPVKKTKKAK